jgi:putative FmdB family regulatory protein
VPLYEYQCPKCGRFELIKKFSDEPVTTCPTCGSEVQKLLSAPAIQFKGTGWYITDYARKGEGKGGKSEGKGGKSDGNGKGESKSEGVKSDGAKDSASTTSSESKPASPAPASKDSGGGKS